MRRQRRLRTGQRHRVMVVLLQRRQRSRWLHVSHLRLLFLLTTLRSLHDLRRSVLVGWVVEKRADVVHKQRIKQLGDFLLVGKVQGPLKRNPVATLEPKGFQILIN